ncbi:MAG: type III pantothenate kinase [Leadbetterella sp.]|nr:type III pantothenate kinase [Leadbetterella sp.]
MIVFDVGNTDTVVGFFRGDELYQKFRIRSLKSENSVFFEYRILNFMLENNIEKTALEVAVISSVVPKLTPFFVNFCKKFLTLDARVVEPARSSLLKLNIDDPEQLGSDLFLNALAAHRIYGGDCVVADFGTALTFTVVTQDGTVEGVNIVPGLNTAIKALFLETSLLPEVPLERPATAVGKDTISSIQAGIYFGYESMIRGLISRIKEELAVPVKVIATGGLSSAITELKELFDDTDPDLTLKGMYYYGQ